jgi:hypothetical protein
MDNRWYVILVRVLGAILGTIVTAVTITVASNNCDVGFDCLGGMLVIGPVAAIIAAVLPRTRAVNLALLAILVVAPIAAGFWGVAIGPSHAGDCAF